MKEVIVIKMIWYLGLMIVYISLISCASLTTSGSGVGMHPGHPGHEVH